MIATAKRKNARIKITDQQISEVLRLDGEGLSQRKVAKSVGISRVSVGLICSGKFRTYKSQAAEPRDGHGGWPKGIGVGPINRCPMCGVRVFGECAACYTLKNMARKKILGKSR